MLRAELDLSCSVRAEVRVCKNELLDTIGAKALLTATKANAISTVVVDCIIDRAQRGKRQVQLWKYTRFLSQFDEKAAAAAAVEAAVASSSSVKQCVKLRYWSYRSSVYVFGAYMSVITLIHFSLHS
jgi:hypothetical protein